MLDTGSSHTQPFSSSSFVLSHVLSAKAVPVCEETCSRIISFKPLDMRSTVFMSCSGLLVSFGKTFDWESHPDMLRPPQMSETNLWSGYPASWSISSINSNLFPRNMPLRWSGNPSCNVLSWSASSFARFDHFDMYASLFFIDAYGSPEKFLLSTSFAPSERWMAIVRGCPASKAFRRNDFSPLGTPIGKISPLSLVPLSPRHLVTTTDSTWWCPAWSAWRASNGFSLVSSSSPRTFPLKKRRWTTFAPFAKGSKISVVSVLLFWPLIATETYDPYSDTSGLNFFPRGSMLIKKRCAVVSEDSICSCSVSCCTAPCNNACSNVLSANLRHKIALGKLLLRGLDKQFRHFWLPDSEVHECAVYRTNFQLTPTILWVYPSNHREHNDEKLHHSQLLHEETVASKESSKIAIFPGFR